MLTTNALILGKRRKIWTKNRFLFQNGFAHARIRHRQTDEMKIDKQWAHFSIEMYVNQTEIFSDSEGNFTIVFGKGTSLAYRSQT